MDVYIFITGASVGSFLGMFIQYFLNKNIQKQLFNYNLKKDFHFKKLEKAFELLNLIDEIKDNITLLNHNKKTDDYLKKILLEKIRKI